MQSDDRIWRERIEERVASNTAGQIAQDGRLDYLQEEVEKFAEMERRFDDLETKVNMLRSVMLPDALGNGGVITRIKALEKHEGREERSQEYKWKFWIALMGLAATLLGVCIKEWGSEIAQRWNHNMEELTAPRTPIKKVRHKKIHKIVEEPATEPEPDVQE